MSDIALKGSDIHSFGMSDIFAFGKCFGSLTAFPLTLYVIRTSQIFTSVAL